MKKKNVYLAEIKNLELELETKKNELYKIKGALEFAESIKANNITSIEYNNNNNNLKNIPILGSLISNNE